MAGLMRFPRYRKMMVAETNTCFDGRYGLSLLEGEIASHR
ncbi:hypothetical protein DCCM_0509 [Desulfocucumis palustris]|uniref:Uncharacterized protein n=1 Tax=Desulfocucumis palustris TaxID=1898651 RepID=A0A2L2X825_9FIRM|nr:hypothetical protein DCCM_0509 [Desulfocucumis palustris]